jgi:type II secretory pathway predicted ATPase ExeA
MDPKRNPFSPGAGSLPPEMVGRQGVVTQAELALARIKAGRAEKSMLMVGLRGVGKTVLLRYITNLSKDSGFKVAMVEAKETSNLPTLLYPHLRQILFELDRGTQASEYVQTAFRTLKSFVSGMKIRLGELEFAYEPLMGVADSGILDADLAQLFLAIANAAKDRNTAIAIVVDELQYLAETELEALIMAVHIVNQHGLPLVVVGAGLPQLVAKAGNAKSYAERLFTYPKIDRLEERDAFYALQQPAEAEGVTFTEAALHKIFEQTQGYPYFLQEWGYQAWNIAQTSTIDVTMIDQVRQDAIARLDNDFFRVRFDRMTPRERDYLRAMAELGPGPHRSGDIAEKLNTEVNKLAPLRGQLIKKGMIFSPAHGDTAFTVPLFDEFMKRIMPNFSAFARPSK